MRRITDAKTFEELRKAAFATSTDEFDRGNRDSFDIPTVDYFGRIWLLMLTLDNYQDGTISRERFMKDLEETFRGTMEMILVRMHG